MKTSTVYYAGVESISSGLLNELQGKPVTYPIIKNSIAQISFGEDGLIRVNVNEAKPTKLFWYARAIFLEAERVLLHEYKELIVVIDDEYVVNRLTNPAEYTFTIDERDEMQRLFWMLKRFTEFSIEFGKIPQSRMIRLVEQGKISSEYKDKALATLNNPPTKCENPFRRESWEVYFMRLALEAATRATCDRARVGCVIAKNHMLIATGYNGSVSGDDHCDDVGHLMVDGHCIRTVHAEANALIQSARLGHSCDGAEIYVTHCPCYICVKTLLQAGIKRIYYYNEYRPDQNTIKLLAKKGVQMSQITLPER